MEASTKFPPLKWAQRADCVIVTIDLPDATDIQTDVDEENQKMTFKAKANGENYAVDMELFEPIVKAESKWNTKGRNVIMSISKKDKEQEEWWPRLTKEKGKNPLITIDWAKWVDPDEDEPADDPMAGMDMNAMGGMGGMPGMGGMGGMPGMEGMMGGGGMPGMPGMGGMGGPGGMDMSQLQAMMGGMNAGGAGADSDDDDGEEGQVEPRKAEEKGDDKAADLNDLDGEETADLKK